MVRGTTLRDSIIKIVSRLKPKKIIIVSSAPQIRYPDCYGIDMSKMKEFVAFQALVKLLKENKKEHLLQEAYEKCLEQEKGLRSSITNQVKALYETFTAEEISESIASIITPPEIQIPIEVIYQDLHGLQQACPLNSGDWYFSGNYPTPGGNRVVNRSFVNYMENRDERAY
jgi:amidophosphoribosyltransferase